MVLKAAQLVYDEIKLPDVDRELRRVLVYAWTSDYVHATKEEMESEDTKALFKFDGDFWYEVYKQMTNGQWATMQKAKSEPACPCVRCGLELETHYRENGTVVRCGCLGKSPAPLQHSHRPVNL